MTIPVYLEVAQALVIMSTGIIASVIAIVGFSTWKDQLRGKNEYDLALSIQLSLYKYRDVVKALRHPMIPANEMPEPSEEECEGMAHSEIRYHGLAGAYQSRWDKVNERRTDFYSDLVEAEVLWGPDLNELFNVLYDLEYKLFEAVKNNLEQYNPNVSDERKAYLLPKNSEIRKLIYGKLSEEDEFENLLNSSIQNIRDYLSPKLLR